MQDKFDFTTVLGKPCQYYRWHADVHAVLDIPVEANIRITREDIQWYIRGLRGEHVGCIQEVYTEYGRRIGKHAVSTTEIKPSMFGIQFIFCHYATWNTKKSYAITVEDARRIANDLEDLMNDVERNRQQDTRDKELEKHGARSRDKVEWGTL